MTVLENIIRELIAYEGKITFERFMRLALYMPVHGYWRKEAYPVGYAGDFLTAPETSTAFARCIVQALKDMWIGMGSPPRFDIAEFGSGRGTLAVAVMTRLRDAVPELYRVSRYFLCEQSYWARKNFNPPQPLRSDGKFVTMSPRDLEPNFLRGCILSNEFFDAFSVHRLQQRNGRLLECYVGLDAAGRFTEAYDRLSSGLIAGFWEMYGVALEDGQAAEVSRTAQGAFDAMVRALAEGYMCTIDYGDLASKLYGALPDGTVMTYHTHQANDAYYTDIGEKDITAHVNFTMLTERGKMFGLVPELFVSQAQFLVTRGIADDMLANMEDLEAVNSTQAIKRLLSPSHMGERFKVLVQKKSN